MKAENGNGGHLLLGLAGLGDLGLDVTALGNVGLLRVDLLDDLHGK